MISCTNYPCIPDLTISPLYHKLMYLSSRKYYKIFSANMSNIFCTNSIDI
nr:MAG TPA: hypothetical protein [Caudoviricetes sp.]